MGANRVRTSGNSSSSGFGTSLLSWGHPTDDTYGSPTQSDKVCNIVHMEAHTAHEALQSSSAGQLSHKGILVQLSQRSLQNLAQQRPS